MGIKVSVLLDHELSRRYKRLLVETAGRHGHMVVGRADAQLVVTDRPLASTAWLTINVAADGEEEVAGNIERVTRLLEQLGNAQPTIAEQRGWPPIEARSRRAHDILELGDGVVDRGRSMFVRGAVETKLTATELSLIERLYAARGSFVSRSTLEREVWGYAEKAQSRTVLTTIHRLRQKVEIDPAAPALILSDRQRGYRLSWEDESSRRLDRELIGRDGLIMDLSRSVDAPSGPRFITLTGPSGIGKTYLAQHLAMKLGRRRALWCDCSGIRTASALAAALSRTLDCRVGEQRSGLALGHALAAREDLVLFLDDLDLTNPEVRELLEALSDQSPHTRMVISSHDARGMRGAVIEVPRLSNEAARALLASRRQHLFPDVPMSEAELMRLVEGCRGLPLFLELTAREPRRPGDASMEVGGMEWIEAAWSSLSNEARHLLGGLSLLPAGFYFDAVEALLPTPATAFRPFTELVTRSLVLHLGPERYTRRKIDLESSRESRFSVLNHIREFALERERGAMLSAARWLADRAERWARGLEGDGTAFGEAMAGFAADEVNLGVATRRVTEDDPLTAERLVLSLGNFLIMHGPLGEALELTRIVRARQDSPRLRFLQARTLTLMGQAGPAIGLLRDLAEDDGVGDRIERARVYDALASLLSQGPEFEQCRATAATLFGDTEIGVAERCESEAATLWAEGRVEEALAETVKALAIFERHRCWRRAIALRINHGSHLRDLGRLSESRRILDAARDEAATLGYGLARRYAELNLAFLAIDEALARGDAPASADERRARLDQARQTFEALAGAARRHGKLLLAARAGVWRALLMQDPLSRRAELEVALSFSLEVADAEASATAAAALGRGGRTPGPMEPSLESLIDQLPPIRRGAILKLAGLIHGEGQASTSTHWRAACWLADEAGSPIAAG